MGKTYLVKGKVLSINTDSAEIELKIDNELSSHAIIELGKDKLYFNYNKEMEFPWDDHNKIVGDEVECKAEYKEEKFIINEIELAGEEE